MLNCFNKILHNLHILNKVHFLRFQTTKSGATVPVNNDDGINKAMESTERAEETNVKSDHRHSVKHNNGSE